MKSITIEGQLRSEFGKKATRLLRSEEKVPCVIYGGAEIVAFSAPATAFKNLVYTPEFQVAEIKLEGKTYRAILKDLQFDTVTDELTHIDFLELVEDKKVVASLPLRVTGQSVGVKAGGKLVVKLKTLKVKALPKDLREYLELDITNLDLNENLRVEDVKAEGIELINSPRIPVASVVMTRQLKQEEAAAEKESKKK
ncbi:50S ribosomal protein L25/general stress protein Ctc [Chitinophaga rhizosphaerae]|uniref:50S ribosomal protein L25/general stress protein Ctc n=1 Tax=Chitinophaga rhizosphaerae TaxID=1864947 RepID=UPI000F7FCCE6|nr:50S ribosomal protein L25/general stress protein Ctc [Chitinophaga rhizosphaerae]